MNRKTRSMKKSNKESNGRLYFIISLCIIGFIIVLIRLSLLSLAPFISDKTSIKDIINISRYFGNWNRYEKLEYERGTIVDRYNNKLAFSVKAYSIGANPRIIPKESKPNIAQIIAQHSNLSFEEVYKKLDYNRNFVWLKRKITQNVFTEMLPHIRTYMNKGLIINEEYKRIYPDSKYFSNIVGFTGMDNIGLEGVEARFNDILSNPGSAITKYVDGVYKEDDHIVKDFSTSNIVLTIDKNIQMIVYEELQKAYENFKAKRAMCVIVNPKTGEVIAMARYPGFDHKNFSRGADRRNWLVTDMYEPGSTIKVVSVAALLQELNLDLNQTVLDQSHVTIHGHTYHNSDRIAFGNINISEAFSKSSNVGIIRFVRPLTRDVFYSYLRNFGFGIVSGIELPGESRGMLRPANRWSGLSKFSISIGQEIAVTPIQLVMALSTVANDGVLVKPTIIKEISNAKGEVIYQRNSIPIRRVLNPDISETINKFMIDAVENGTGRRARIPNVQVAGKTGTAQKAIRGEYSRDKYIASFFGYFPADNPEYAMLVIVDEPSRETSIYGGVVAAPVFRNIGTRILEYKNEIQQNVIYKDYIVRNRIGRNNLFEDNYILADLQGVSLRNALNYLSNKNIQFKLNGTGYVKSQYPSPGTNIKSVQQVVLNLSN